MKKLKTAIWIITATNYRDSALTATTKREAEDKARARGLHVKRVETIEEYKARTAPRIIY